MKVFITGGLRSVANSAWISTIDEDSALRRSDDEVNRVTSFLADNFHTSPFECVTLTFTWSESYNDVELQKYIDSKFSRASFSDKERILTIDLWNFIKISGSELLWNDNPAWLAFESADPELAAKCRRFDFSGQKLDKADDVSPALGKHGMSVDLISFHKSSIRSHSRATWRVKCPLSIAVQILRHRTGSFNMVSARYRTIKQDIVGKLDDVIGIYGKIYKNKFNKGICAEALYDIYHNSVYHSINEYRDLMSDAKKSVNKDIISKSEYKRIREYARYVLPEGRMTELYVTFYLDDFDNYLKLRNSNHSQTEHVWIAQQMNNTLSLSTEI